MSEKFGERTQSRLRFVAPPGLAVGDSSAETKTIGRYEILKTLGQGAMGVVYKARDPYLDRIVAVKTIGSPKGVGRRARTAYLERFEREAKAAAKMQHPAIVTIFDVGQEHGAPFMVLEYLPGETLADRLDRVRMPLGKAIPIALDLASALAFAHKERIVHRDLKPANVLHAGEDRWKLADFGIARLPDSDLTQVGIFMGTPGYSPPEAIRDGRYTAQADVFAWGAVLYELISGYIPYEGPDTQTTNGYVIRATAQSPRSHDPTIPEPIADVVMRALDPSTDVRYKSGAEAEKALRAVWEDCLRTGLVSPMALAGKEVPHDRVSVGMHGQVVNTGNPPPVPNRLPPSPVSSHAIIDANHPPLNDDDPTRIVVREQRPEGQLGAPALPEPTTQRAPVAAAAPIGVPMSPSSPISQPAMMAKPPVSYAHQGVLQPRSSSSSTWVWVAWIAIALVVGVALAIAVF